MARKNESNYIARSIGIWYTDVGFAHRMFDQIAYNLPQECIVDIEKFSKTGTLKIELIDGSRILFPKAHRYNQMLQFTHVYIQEEIEKEVQEKLIIPTLSYGAKDAYIIPSDLDLSGAVRWEEYWAAKEIGDETLNPYQKYTMPEVQKIIRDKDYEIATLRIQLDKEKEKNKQIISAIKESLKIAEKRV